MALTFKDCKDIFCEILRRDGGETPVWDWRMPLVSEEEGRREVR